MDYYYKGYFIAVGGVAEEPANMALFLNIFCPLSLYHLKQNRSFVKYFFLLVMYICSMVFLSSIAGIFWLILAIVLVNTRYILFKNRNLIFSLIFIFLTFLSIFILKDSNFFSEFYSKIFLSEDNLSSFLRVQSWLKGFEVFFHNPLFGAGPGYGVFALGTGYHSFYLTILADVGLFAFIFLFLFLFSFQKYLKVIRSKYLKVSFIAAIGHYLVISDYYHAPLWMLLIIINIVKDEKLILLKNENKYRNASL
ncbi:MAG: O-antigen ligase family protein [Cytophagales bacterium]